MTLDQQILRLAIGLHQIEQHRQDSGALVTLPQRPAYLAKGEPVHERSRTLALLRIEQARGPGLQGLILGRWRVTLN